MSRQLRKLVAEAFQRGCGTSLEAARTDPRFVEILRQVRGLRFTDEYDRTLVALLGEQLADRAYKNMPPAIRDKVHLWKEGVEGQRKLLHLICEELVSRKWQPSRQTQFDPDDIRNVLPHESGSWLEGPVQPNCLGLFAMMEGFARHVGATYCVLNVLTSYEIAAIQRQVDFLEKLHSTIENYPSDRKEMEQITARLKAAVENMQAHYRKVLEGVAHHALMVRLDDGVWWIVDPYLTTYYPFDAELYRTHLINQHNTIFMSGRGQKASYEIKFDAMAETFRKLHQAVKDEVSPETLALLIVDCGLHCLANKDLAVELASPPEDPDWQHLNSVEVSLILEKCYGPDEVPQDLDDLTLAWRMIARFLKGALDYVNNVYCEPDSRRHESLELSSPGLGLAVATLNQMQLKYAESGKWVKLGGVLATLMPGQWIIADALALVDHGDRLTSAAQHQINVILNYLRGQPRDKVIPPLWKYL